MNEISQGFTGVEINGVRFFNIGEMLRYMDKQREQLTKAKNLLQKVADVCGYPNYDIPVVLYSEIADFLKDGEVEKWTVLNAIKEWKSSYWYFAIIMFVNIADI